MNMGIIYRVAESHTCTVFIPIISGNRKASPQMKSQIAHCQLCMKCASNKSTILLYFQLKLPKILVVWRL